MSRPLSRFNLRQLMYWAGNAKLLDNNLKCKSDPVLPGKKKKPKTNHNKNVSSTL